LGLLDSSAEEPQSKLLRYIITTTVFLLLLWLGYWWLFRFQTEKKTVETFLSVLAAGDTQGAYQIWKPSAGYTYDRFLEDWGPSGSLYGPVKSFRVRRASQPEGASGVVVTAEVSPYAPFPAETDTEKHRQTKEVLIWVERRDQSLSFPP